MHFWPEDIWRETSVFDKKTGNMITIRLKPFLHDGATLKILPNCPSYLSSSSPSRETPNSKKIQQENSVFKNALDQSIADDLVYK